MSVGHVRLRAFAQATEDVESVVRAVRFVCGKGELMRDTTEGHFGNPITIIEAGMKRSQDIKVLLRRLGRDGILSALLDGLEERMDDDCVLHLRLDKQNAYLGRLSLAQNRDVIDCSMKVMAYPANRAVALATAEKCLRSFLG
jgi:RNA binding exosome subunit